MFPITFGSRPLEKHFVCKKEPESPTDEHAVAVMVNSIVVGHILRRISIACSLFLRQNGSTVHLDNAINGLYIGRF